MLASLLAAQVVSTAAMPWQRGLGAWLALKKQINWQRLRHTVC